MEEIVTKKYKVNIQIISPVNIGAGAENDWVIGVDYVISDGRLYHLNINKMAKCGIDVNYISSLYSSGHTNSEDVLKLIGNKLKDVSDFTLEAPDVSSQNPIKCQIRNQLSGNPIIPGSSIKGAIRSILFSYLTEHGTHIDQVDTLGRQKKSTQLNQEVFGKLNDGEDFMRFVRISDFEFGKNSTELDNTKIFNLMSSKQGGWKHGGHNTTENFKDDGFNTIYECLAPNGSTSGYIALASKEFLHAIDRSHPQYDKLYRLMSTENPLQTLFTIAKQHTKMYLDKEHSFFTKYDNADYADDILASIEYYQEQIEKCSANQCIIKMSAGSGFHSITGDWQFDDYTVNSISSDRGRSIAQGENIKHQVSKTAKSRKIAVVGETFDLMGFVKLSIVED